MSPSTKPSLRRSQIITTFGPGAIVDFTNSSVMLTSVDRWTGNLLEIHEPQLERMLHVSGFRAPSLTSDGNGSDVPAVIFPRWMICPKCHRLAPYDQFSGLLQNLNNPIKCPTCNVRVYPARLIVACPNGHIDDFPWVEWAHRESGKVCDHPILYLDSYGLTSSLGDIRVQCATCGEGSNLGSATNPKAVQEILPACSGKRPWMLDQQEGCTEKPRPLQRGASNVYFPVNVSSISIPPWSRGINSIINPHWSIIKSIPEEALPLTIENLRLGTRLGMSTEDIMQAIKERRAHETDPSLTITERDLRIKEVKALQIRSQRDDIHAELQTTPEPVEEIISKYISRVTLVERLREVKVLRGFTRIDPPDPSSSIQQTMCPIAHAGINWLPAVEVRGEGIYIELQEESVRSWSKNQIISKRAEQLHRTYTNICERRGWEISRTITPRFLLVHSLAHALIRQLALDSGYSSASIRERLYAFEPSADNTRSGVAGMLLYTSTPDSEGSLGGLVRLGKKRFFTNTLTGAIQSATWCSSDPLCMESTGQGPDSTNMAACHACLLLPETSCEEFNRFLDRAALVGTLSHPDAGYFSPLVNNKAN